MVGCYDLSDVFGPIPINDDTNKEKVLECLSFYHFLNLPSSTINVKYSERSEVEKGAERMIQDIKEYIRYFRNEINDDQDQNEQPYEFNKTLYICGEKEGKARVLTDEFYSYNIVTFVEMFAKFGRELTILFDHNIVIKFEILSILKMVESNLASLKTGNDVIAFSNNFISDRQNMDLIKAVLFMVIEDATNIMKVVKGILLVYQEDENISL